MIVASSCQSLMTAGLKMLAGESEPARGPTKCTNCPTPSHLPKEKVTCLFRRQWKICEQLFVLEDPSAAPHRALTPVFRQTTWVCDLLIREMLTRGWMLTRLQVWTSPKWKGWPKLEPACCGAKTANSTWFNSRWAQRFNAVSFPMCLWASCSALK